MRSLVGALFALLASGPAIAGDWDGTWIDALGNGGEVQLIIAGDEAIGLFLDGDYVADLTSQVASDGRTMTLHWGTNVEGLARLDDGMIGLMVEQYGKPDIALVLKPDK